MGELRRLKLRMYIGRLSVWLEAAALNESFVVFANLGVFLISRCAKRYNLVRSSATARAASYLLQVLRDVEIHVSS